jgi:hypothetical protein
MKIPSFIRHVRSRWKDFGRRMRSPSVASNGTKVREDETEVLAGSREVASCLPIDLEAEFRLRLRNVSALTDARSNALLGSWVGGVEMARNHLDVSRDRPSARHYPETGLWEVWAIDNGKSASLQRLIAPCWGVSRY